MEAREVRLRDLLGSDKVYVVPLFQRPYSWERQQWKQLWEDIEELYEGGEGDSHFLGAVVYLPLAHSAERADQFLLIDGQQRLSTLLLLLRVIAQHAGDLPTNHQNLCASIMEKYVQNHRPRDPRDLEKLIPTQRDRDAYSHFMNGNPFDGSSSYHEAARMFRDWLAEGQSTGEPFDLYALHDAVVSRIMLVSVRLEQNDSPHRVFETLNSRGMDLSEVDLIRNHVFMRIESIDQQEYIYNTTWLPMEEQLRASGKTALGDFFWRFLMMEGDLPRKDSTYEAMRVRIDSWKQHEDLVQKLDNLRSLSGSYLQLANPREYEKDPRLANQMNKLNDWELQTAYPLLLKLYDARNAGAVDTGGCLAILNYLESYVLRRWVCAIPTNRLRRIFTRMAKDFEATECVNNCAATLRENNWPSDADFSPRLATYPLYQNSRERTQMLLDAIERSFSHHEHVEAGESISIEHVMPQTLSYDWRVALGPDADEVHERLVHTLGNLTLTGYNADMSNRPFAEKRQLLANSHFELNRWIAEQGKWTAEEIERRGRELADRATKIWPRPL